MRLTPAEENHPGMIHGDRTRPHLAMQFLRRRVWNRIKRYTK
jgi:hypothetical protein